ncbi:L,D-transpeptidase family protein [Egicoccus sp. AB-alg6-2]|uniref:L,D-transpeptidase family protein n=1 Tax=Egicoccus sp. AB-alg6-2 TaxID=3242692 RepID=UPI00359D4007
MAAHEGLGVERLERRGRQRATSGVLAALVLMGCTGGPGATELAAETAAIAAREAADAAAAEAAEAEANRQEQTRREEERARAAAQERAEQERAEQERLEQERLVQERLEQERLEQEEAARAEEEARREAEERRERTVQAQQRLQELGYLVGAADGAQGQQTTAAVMAFQAVNGLQVDGIVGPRTLAALADPPAVPHLQGGPDDRIEIDLTRQVLHLVENGVRVVTMKVSSGNGATYEVNDGTSAEARTPVGTFRIQRRIAGVRESSLGLGTLFDPMYFHLGYAIHGSNSVPAGPASHGCVRVSRADAIWLFDRVPDGFPVQLYGGTHVFAP